jgi:hypothetical protein
LGECSHGGVQVSNNRAKRKSLLTQGRVQNCETKVDDLRC